MVDNNEYFNWLCDIVCKNRFSKSISYERLLRYLHKREFVWDIQDDANRAKDGLGLRKRFGIDRFYAPCSVLEMMVALAVRCEETIMDDPSKGDRTGQWFWGMINNMGLGAMHNDNFDEEKAAVIITRFLNRDYYRNGEGGLFTIRDPDEDIRDVDIWTQLCWYLDSIS